MRILTFPTKLYNMKKQDMHDWALTILLTALCYLVVDKLIVSLSLWKYLIIEAVLVLARYFHMFVMKNNFPDSYIKPKGFL